MYFEMISKESGVCTAPFGWCVWNLIWSCIFTNFQYWLLLFISHKSFLLILHNYLHFNNFVRKCMSFKTHSAPSFLEYFHYILILQWFSSLILRMHIGFFYHFCIYVIWVDNGQFKSSVFSQFSVFKWKGGAVLLMLTLRKFKTWTISCTFVLWQSLFIVKRLMHLLVRRACLLGSVRNHP